MSAWAEATEWAKTLTDIQLHAALEEMRSRGAAVAYYDAAELVTLFDSTGVDTANTETWMKDHREAMEETMCEAARSYYLIHGDNSD